MAAIAVSWRYLGNSSGVIAYADEALRVVPRHAPSLSNLGIHYFRMERYVEACRCFELALKVAPKDQLLRENLGAAHIWGGAAHDDSFTEALSYFEDTLGIPTSDGSDLLFTVVSVSMMKSLMKPGSREENFRALAEALKVGPSGKWLMDTVERLQTPLEFRIANQAAVLLLTNFQTDHQRIYRITGGICSGAQRKKFLKSFLKHSHS